MARNAEVLNYRPTRLRKDHLRYLDSQMYRKRCSTLQMTFRG